MPKATDLIYSVEDADGDVATTAVKLPSSASLVDLQEFSEAQATLMDAILDGKIIGAGASFNVDVSGLTVNLSSGADDVEDVGSFQFRTVDGRPVIVNVPGIDENKVIVGADDLNQVDVDIAAFIAMMTNGLSVTGGTIIPCDVGEDDITTIDYARERFRASGKRA